MGGWFNQKIETVDDLKGLKMRIPGLGGKVLAKAGGTPILLAGGEIYTALGGCPRIAKSALSEKLTCYKSVS